MSRELIVMLPGMMCDARLFAPQIAALEDRYDILVPPLCAPDSIEGLAKRVLNEIAAPQFNLLGLSMGGIVAMQMAGLAPERIERLVLLDTNHLADAPDRHAIRSRQIAEVRAGYLRRVIAEEMKPNYLARANRLNIGLLEILISMAMDLGADCFINQSVALRDRKNQSDSLQRFDKPVLLLCGAEDTLCPPSRHADIAALMKFARRVEVQNAGHIVTLENAAAVIEELRDFLRTPV